MKELLLSYGPALLLWVAVAYKLPTIIRAPRDPGRRWLWLTLFFLTLAITVLLPPVYVGIDGDLGRANLARLLSNGLTLVSCWTAQALLAHLNGADAGRTVQRTGILLAVALGAMAYLFLTAPVSQEALDFPERYATMPHVLEYRLVFLAYLGFAEVQIARLSWRYARVAPHASLRLGLRIDAAGGFLATLYVLHDGSYLISRRLGIAYPLGNPGTIEPVLIALAVAMFAIGATMPTWGPRIGVTRLCGWVSQYRSLRRLYSLWIALRRSCPEIALLPAPSSLVDVWDVRDVKFRLYRRVIEIRDGILALRPYGDPMVVAAAAQSCREEKLGTDETEAVVEAVGIVVGQCAKERGEGRVGELDGAKGGGNDLDQETAYLGRVARAYARSTVVRATRAQLVARAPESNENMRPSKKGHGDGAMWPVP
jgi:hypothetical protein